MLVVAEIVSGSDGMTQPPIMVTAEPVASTCVGHAGTTVEERCSHRGLAVPFADEPPSLDFSRPTPPAAVIPESVHSKPAAPDEDGHADDSEGPAPAITDPISGATFRCAPVTISGTAEPGSTIELVDWLLRAGVAQVDDTGRWTVTLPTVEEGAHLYHARLLGAGKNASACSALCEVNVGTSLSETPAVPAPSTRSRSKVLPVAALARKLLARKPRQHIATEEH